MEKQYGFDEETAKIMLKVYHQLIKKYPKATQAEIDWRYTRLMGGFQYEGYQWNQTAGVATSYKNRFIGTKKLSEEEYFTEFLKISNEEYQLLRYKVRVQNFYAGKGNADAPSLGPDDYIADLDAENITYMMKEEKYSYWEACDKYYREVGKDYTRAEKFLEHTDLESVKKDIFGELSMPAFIREQGAQSSTLTGETSEEMTRKLAESLTEDDHMKKLKEIAPDTYNFIRSLEEPEKHHEMRR